MVLDNLCEVFGCSVITGFISTKFGFAKVLFVKKLLLIVLLVLCFCFL